MLNTFLYHFQAGSETHRFIHMDRVKEFNNESYTPLQIKHNVPTWSEEAQDAEIDVEMIASDNTPNPLAEILMTPPPYPIILTIYEWLGDTAIEYYKGWIVRCPFRLKPPIIVPHLKTLWHFYERESLTDSLSSLSRYSVYDPRSGADISALGVAVTIDTLNDQRDVLTVTGITQIDGWFTGGFIEAPNLDKRTILDHTGSILTLNGGFPQFTLSEGFNATIYPGDDLTYATWANKFQSLTNNGEAWGGWEYTPNVDPAVRGVI